MSASLVSVVCMNPACLYYQQTRTVGLAHLGQDVYQHPTLVCGCSPRQPLQMLPDDRQPGQVPDDVVLAD